MPVGSLMAGFADGVALKLAGRAVQGAGSVLIAPAALTLLFTNIGSTPGRPPIVIGRRTDEGRHL